VEIQHDCAQRSPRVLIIDDLLATGGHASACAELVDHWLAGSFGFGFRGRTGRSPGGTPAPCLLISPWKSLIV